MLTVFKFILDLDLLNSSVNLLVLYSFNLLGVDTEEKKITFDFKKDPSKGYVNNSDFRRDYYFTDLFDQPAKQTEVFEAVARDVIDNCLDGYNGTIFAYGQTGSGKTFTITGGERYEDRGIIPRTLSYIFKQIEQRTDTSYNVLSPSLLASNKLFGDL